MKGTAFVAAGLAAGQGRGIGDCDILLPRPLLDHAEKLLVDAGWEWMKSDPYDDLYYRQWMHELPRWSMANGGGWSMCTTPSCR
ncbi:hypothetical protein GCM10020258_41450 [Sphingomonas yabuuchiae]